MNVLYKRWSLEAANFEKCPLAFRRLIFPESLGASFTFIKIAEMKLFPFLNFLG